MSKQTHTFTRMSFPTRVKEPLPSGGFTTKPGPNMDATVEVTIDLAEIARLLGYRASLGKSKKATALGGLITVKTIPQGSTK